MPGFGNDFETEALPGALPQGQNSPQKCAYGLYAEQLSGIGLHRAASDERTWCYRIRPSVKHTTRFDKDRRAATGNPRRMCCPTSSAWASTAGTRCRMPMSR